MGPMSQQQVVAIINVALRMLAERVLTFASLLCSAVLFGWVMYAPDLTRLGAATLFSLIVFLSSARHEQAKKQEGGE